MPARDCSSTAQRGTHATVQAHTSHCPFNRSAFQHSADSAAATPPPVQSTATAAAELPYRRVAIHSRSDLPSLTTESKLRCKPSQAINPTRSAVTLPSAPGHFRSHNVQTTREPSSGKQLLATNTDADIQLSRRTQSPVRSIHTA